MRRPVADYSSSHGCRIMTPAMTLTTDRLLLREFTEDDWPRVREYQLDPMYLRYYPWTPKDRSPEAVRDFVAGFMSYRTESPRTRYQLAVTLKPEGVLIGNCGIRRSSADQTTADLGYELDPKYWGRGYASEAAEAMVSFGFSRLGLHRIEATCVADNLGSIRILEKLGMRLEGRLRERDFYKGRWWDTLSYGILAQEWSPP